MTWKALFLVFLMAGLLIPPVYSAVEAMEKPGYLFVEAPSGLVAEIVGVALTLLP
ncbi:hypothetical protein [Thermococcus piezophilus]|uniref:hypothetical protein n=1 Tax=Thermococcus piezophilus TaxID=1712654 RepID=UPI000B283F15|nr:hypothetical protein [Thermococcus piezophilus]